MSDYKCPYCKTEIEESEHDYAQDETKSVDCPECEKPFEVTADYSVDYTARGDCKLTKEMPHTLRVVWDSPKIKQWECTKCAQEYYDWQLPGGKHPTLEDGEFTFVSRDGGA